MAANADGIDRNEAFMKAQRVLPDRHFVADAAAPRAKAPRTNEPYYIFNAADNGGFVIVSADDRATEILGYALQGNLDEASLPPNVQWWLEGYARQIESLQDTEPMPATDVAERRAPATAIDPMLTTRWNQAAPYNLWCPDGNYVDYDEPGYDATNRCLTGCGATAMAQLMRYWEWPTMCNGISSYVFDNHTIKALPATTFKWYLMQDSYATGPSADAVAELMRYCGQAVQMKYGTGSSSSYSDDVVAGMISYFHYSPNCFLTWRDAYTNTHWENIIYEELTLQRPVLYGGYSSAGGHLFIIDGCDADGLCHINWGWGGRFDGFYALSALNPTTENPYQYDHHAIIGMQPIWADEQLLPTMQCSISLSAEAELHYRTELLNIQGSVVAEYNVEPTAPLTAEIGWALYLDDTFQQVLVSKNITIPTQTQEHFLNNVGVRLNDDLASGTYLLCQVYRFEGDTEWHLCYPYRTYAYMMVLELTSSYFVVRPYDKVKDAITAIAAPPAATSTWYNLQGIPLSHPRKGLYIHDHRKILVK